MGRPSNMPAHTMPPFRGSNAKTDSCNAKLVGGDAPDGYVQNAKLRAGYSSDPGEITARNSDLSVRTLSPRACRQGRDAYRHVP